MRMDLRPSEFVLFLFSNATRSVWRQGSTHSAALQNGCPGGVDVGHQLMGLLVAAVGVVALGQRKIGDRELLGGDRSDVAPEPLEQRHSIIRKQTVTLPAVRRCFPQKFRQKR